MRALSRFIGGFVLVISVLSSSGCLINRIQTVQEQACEFDENFILAVGDDISITFLKPVLYYDDVAFIAGLAPQLEKLGDNRYRASYVIRKAGEADRLVVPLNLVFVLNEDELLLSSISWQSPVPVTFDDIHWSQLAGDMCDTGIPLLHTRMEVPIPEFNRSVIPTREQLIELGGKPTLRSIDGNELQYDFVLEGANNDELSGSIKLVYDTSGQNLLRTNTRFYHYNTGADFEQGKAWGEFIL